jgi:hypothetical protein
MSTSLILTRTSTNRFVALRWSFKHRYRCRRGGFTLKDVPKLEWVIHFTKFSFLTMLLTIGIIHRSSSQGSPHALTAQSTGVHCINETSAARPPTRSNTSSVLDIRPEVNMYKKQGDDYSRSCPQIPGSPQIIQQQHSMSKHDDIPALELQQAPQLKWEPALPPPLERQGMSLMDVHRLGQLPPITFSPPSGISARAPPVLSSIRGPDEPSLSALSTAPQPHKVVAQRKGGPTIPGKGDRSSSRYTLPACNTCSST